MSTMPYAGHKPSWRSWPPVAASLALVALVFAPPPSLWGQGAAEEPSSPPAVQFELLDMSTGRGSKPQASVGVNAIDLNIQALEPAKEEPPSISAGPSALPGMTPAPPRLLTPLERELMEKNAPLIAELEQWHRQAMMAYNLDVTALSDPFMPIKEVRGSIEDEDDNAALDMSLPAILRLDLSQLKLVAITVFSDREGALASFEDGAGSSFILRQGERIGRNNGKIVKITPSAVTIEETGRSGKEKPRVTEIKLSVPGNSSGLTISK